MPSVVVIAGACLGAMLLFAGLMMALGAVARRADQHDPGWQGQRAAVAPVTAGEPTSGGRPVLAACRKCLSVVAGGHQSCPACGGPLVPTHSLDVPVRDPTALRRTR